MGKKGCAFDALLFDLGGTLIYFEGDKQEIIDQADQALAHALQALGFEIDPFVFINAYETRLQKYFGHRDETLIEYTTRRLLAELLADQGYVQVEEEKIRTALRAMYEVFEANWYVEKDAKPLMKMLKRHGCRVGLISNAADDDDVQRQVDNAGLRPFLDVILTSAATGVRKPHPGMFEKAMQELGVDDPSRVLMVGDRLNADIAGAKEAGNADGMDHTAREAPGGKSRSKRLAAGCASTVFGRIDGLDESVIDHRKGITLTI